MPFFCHSTDVGYEDQLNEKLGSTLPFLPEFAQNIAFLFYA
ncbi:hypothetical protein DDI_3378 [Dickeya dianthicola RNS04.9]|nr:hypothetical protein DDI_3378 [Dickeya dianthicola RNS04.9]